MLNTLRTDFPTHISNGFVHFNGETDVWTFTLERFAGHSEHIELRTERTTVVAYVHSARPIRFTGV
jgi:hypothetical protein